MLTSDDLLAISELLDVKLKAELKSELQPIKDDIRDIKLDIENTIKPQIRLLAENYVPAARRFEDAAGKIDSMQADIQLLKMVVAEHSEQFQKLQVVS